MSPDPVRSLETGDLDWVLALTRARRESLAPVAPRFWRPSADATAIHGAYLKSLITDADVVGLRTDDGYLIVQRQGPLWVVDDMVVSPDAAWPTDGVSLLRAAQDRCGRLRFVVPVVEGPRLAAAKEVGLGPVESWWHRDLPPASHVRAAGNADPAVRVKDAECRLMTAPPIYDPGGPVLLVTHVGSPDGLALIETAAARRGAHVAVVTLRPDDGSRTRLLTSAGYRLTSLFCEPAPG